MPGTKGRGAGSMNPTQPQLQPQPWLRQALTSYLQQT